VLERIEQVRVRAPRIRDEAITMAHGAGGKATHTLVEVAVAGAQPLCLTAGLVLEEGPTC
jgi:hydrogenase maturation factor